MAITLKPARLPQLLDDPELVGSSTGKDDA